MAQNPNRNPHGLPARWHRNRLFAAGLVLAAAGLFAFALRRVDHADQVDSAWLNARYAFREKLRDVLRLPTRPDPDIAIVGIDPKCEEAWTEPDLLWGPHFARVVNRLRVSGARVIVFDYVPYCDPTDYVLPRWRDTEWSDALRAADNVIWAKKYRRSSDGKANQVLPHETLLYASLEAATSGADRLLGFAEFPQGKAVVASLRPVFAQEEGSVSLPARAVERYFHADGISGRGGWRIPGRPILPLRSDGTMLPNYPDNMGYFPLNRAPYIRPSSNPPFLRISMFDFVSQPDRPDPRLKGKIVFIGDTLDAGHDRHDIPFLSLSSTGEQTRKADGVEIQAAFTRALLRGQILREPDGFWSWGLCVLLPAVGVLCFLRMRWTRAAVTMVGLAAGWILLSFILFCSASFALQIFIPLGGLLITSFGMIALVTVSEQRERRQVLGLWGHYQDPRLVDYLLKYPDARGGEGEEKSVTVLFADLVDFTQTVEKLSPREAMRVLNRYLALVERVVLKHGGLIDKYLGDGLMAQWGAPTAPGAVFREDHARAAVAACLEIEACIHELDRQSPDAQHFNLRLTLHTGPVVFGWVGASRLEFTVIGDTVNVTSRLQETAKQLNAGFLISAATYAEASDLVEVKPGIEIQIRGRVDRIVVREVIGPKLPETDVRPAELIRESS